MRNNNNKKQRHFNCKLFNCFQKRSLPLDNKVACTSTSVFKHFTHDLNSLVTSNIWCEYKKSITE